MTGVLGLLTLVDLLQLLVSGKRSGRLDVDHPDGPASIWLDEGRITHAEFDAHTGRNALYALMADERGTYAFNEGAVAPRESIRDGVEQLLLDAIRRTDATRTKSRDIRDTYIGDGVPTVIVNEDVASDLVLQPDELAFLRYADGRRSVNEVADLAELNMMTVRQVISRLLHLGALKVAQRRPRTARLVTRLARSGLPFGVAGIDPAILASWRGALGYRPERIACRAEDGAVSVHAVSAVKKAGPLIYFSRDTLLKGNFSSDTAMLVKPVPRRPVKPPASQTHD